MVPLFRLSSERPPSHDRSAGSIDDSVGSMRLRTPGVGLPALVLWAATGAGSAGCATGGAKRAFQRGNYAEASAMADDSLRANPADGDMIALRQSARDRSTDQEIARIASFRTSGHRDAALAEMDRLLKQLRGWGGRDALSPATRSAFDGELAAMPDLVASLIDGDLGAGRPLAAEAAFPRLAPLLAHPELAAASRAATVKIRAKGQEACTRLQAAAMTDSPHWQLTVDRYCEHFGAAARHPTPPAPPAPFELTGTVKGMNAGQTAALRERVTDWIRASLWNDPTARPASPASAVSLGHGSIEGAVESSFHRQTITLHERYDDVITTTAVVPVEIRNQFGTKPPGVSTSSTGLAVGSTKVNREFAYDTEEIRGHYGMNVTIRLTLGAPAPVTLKLKRVEDTKGYEHEVTFEPAGISPRRDRVLTADEWVNTQLDGFATRVTWALNRRFVRTWCERPQYSVEEAARCLVAGLKPPAALAVVTAALGENAEAAIALLGPPPPPENQRQARAKPVPARQRPAAAQEHSSAHAQDDEDPIVN